MRQFKGSNAYGGGFSSAAGGNQEANVPPVKLPRTGIEQVFTGERPRFIETHREFERIAAVNVSRCVHFGCGGSSYSRGWPPSL